MDIFRTAHTDPVVENNENKKPPKMTAEIFVACVIISWKAK